MLHNNEAAACRAHLVNLRDTDPSRFDNLCLTIGLDAVLTIHADIPVPVEVTR